MGDREEGFRVLQNTAIDQHLHDVTASGTSLKSSMLILRYSVLELTKTPPLSCSRTGLK